MSQPMSPNLPTPRVGTAGNFWSRAFGAVAGAPLPAVIAVLIILGVQTFPFLGARDLWAPGEVRQAAIYMEAGEGGNRLIPSLNGAPLPDAQPGYYWFLRALDQIPGLDQPSLFPAGAAVSAALLLIATGLLAGAAGMGGRRIALGAMLVLMACFFFMGAASYAGPEPLFAALVTFALAGLYHGLQRPEANIGTVLGFACAGLAALVNGPLGLALPFAGMLLWLISRLRLGRLNRLDVPIGIVAMLLPSVAWLAALLATGHREFAGQAFLEQLIATGMNPPVLPQTWWRPGLTVVLAWLPWALLILVLPFALPRLGGKKAQAETGPGKPGTVDSDKAKPGKVKTDRLAGAGASFLISFVIAGFVLLSLFCRGNPVCHLPLLPALAVLSSRALFKFEGRRLRWFARLYGLLLLLLALALAVAAAWPLPWLPERCAALLPERLALFLPQARGLWILAVAAFIAALLLFGCSRRNTAAGVLILSTLFMTVFALTGAGLTAPSLNALMSPRNQGEHMGDLARRGYNAAVYGAPGDRYAYYAGMNVPGIFSEAELSAFAAGHAHQGLVLAMSAKDWNGWTNRPEGLRVVQRQWIVDAEYVLAVRAPDSPAVESPAVESARPEADGEAGPAVPVEPWKPAPDAATPEDSASQGRDGGLEGLAPEGSDGPGVPSMPDVPDEETAPERIRIETPALSVTRLETSVPADGPVNQSAPAR